MQSAMKRFFTSAKSNAEPFKDQLKRMLNPPKVTDGFIPDKDAPIHLTLRNGISHFSLPLHRLVFNYCPHNGDSRPLMEYLEKNLIKLAEDNPTVEIVVSCRFNTRATVSAFYNGDLSKGKCIYVGGGKSVTAESVAEHVQRLRDSSGAKPRRFRLQVESLAPAIRPIPSPFD